MLIQHITGCIRNGSSDRDRAGLLLKLRDQIPRREGGVFYRTIKIDQPSRWPCLQNASDPLGVCQVPSKLHRAHVCESARNMAHHVIEQWRRQEQPTNLAPLSSAPHISNTTASKEASANCATRSEQFNSM